MKPSSLPYRQTALACAVSLLAQQPVLADETNSAESIEEMHIIGLRDERTSKGAIGLDLSLFNTPQSVSIIDRALIDDFALDNITELLKLAVGVNVDEVETDRTYFNSRGFDIKSMQVDGHGLPFTWNLVGDLDTFIYDKVEVVRGANGLLTGTGNPSGTINYVRKRPTNDLQAHASLELGSWNKRRIEADISTPITESGSWAARIAVADLSTDSHLDNYSKERRIAYGVIDGQLSRNATFTAGLTHQAARSENVLWGALPLQNSDGSQAEYVTSASTTMNWSFYETDDTSAFAELQLELGNWIWTTTLTHNDREVPSELFYTYGDIDADTGLGLYGWPGKYLNTRDQNMLDSTLIGDFELAGRNHGLAMGLNASKSNEGYLDYVAPADSPAWGALPSFPGWSGNEIPRPNFGEGSVESDFDTNTKRLYAVANWSLSDKLSLITGANFIDATSKGFSFGETMDRDDAELSPYIGTTYEITQGVNLYASYSDIYEPQGELNEELTNLGPAVGTSSELGVKAELLNGELLTSASVFTANQENYAEYAGFEPETGLSYYSGIEINAKGFELEASGKITDELLLTAGYTQLSLESPEGDDVRTYVPRKTLKATAQYTPVEALSIGASVRWQSKIANGPISQDSYAVLSAYVSYDINEAVNVALNLNNITDTKYLTSLYWSQSYYAAPQNAQLSASYRF